MDPGNALGFDRRPTIFNMVVKAGRDISRPAVESLDVTSNRAAHLKAVDYVTSLVSTIMTLELQSVNVTYLHLCKSCARVSAEDLMRFRYPVVREAGGFQRVHLLSVLSPYRG